MKLLGFAGRSSFSLSLDLTPSNHSSYVCSVLLPSPHRKNYEKSEESEVDSESSNDEFSGEENEEKSGSDDGGPGP